MNLTRIWEKIMGEPHQRQMSERVTAAAADLSAAARRINAQLAPYKDQPDPFTALMADLYERRQLENLHKGPDK
jgi:hypothetical protein